ncbi:dual specificity protein kinase YAK1 [Tanacetum coccineum]|uniref:Dual specificity protein kinase YAK1 n=1 Tax=Tanacetum coccineum TaxID=301880 RepID=A0ABQ5HRV6_9ASTR
MIMGLQSSVLMDEVNVRGSSQNVGWSPKQLAFRPYNANTANLRVAVKKPLVSRLTKDLVETYRICNPDFNYSEELNPKRFLTSPSTGVLNDGHDNTNSDLILSVNLNLTNSETHRKYIVKDMLGQGTFGQVCKCWVAELDRFVAVKIIKNQPAYYQQALVEVSILTTLNKKFDPDDKHHIVRIYDYFVYQRHLCIAFELLDTNLYELIKLNHFRGLSLNIVQLFSKQILCGLALMKDAAIIHCDLKPENILLCTSVKPPEVKIIDFGSACMEDHTVYSYIQSRYYRSPEVVLGYQYSTAIDMWSFGCIVAELFLGLPLFPGQSEFDLLKRMIKIIGGQPPDYLLKDAKNTSKFFKCVGSVNHEESSQPSSSGRSVYQALSEEEYEARERKKPTMGKEYYHHMNLESIVEKYPYKKNLQEEDLAKEIHTRLMLIDFLKGLVEFDPAKRWSPLQASKHPFVTGEPFTGPYIPAPETPRVPVSHHVKVDHNPAGGHWFAAGLSPNVLGGNRGSMYNNSHFQVMPYAHGGNFGSLGSHGSYNDGIALGSSYGSYGDNSNMLQYYSPVGPSAMNNYAQNIPVLGTSPDARRRIMQIPQGNGFGFSPAGNFAPMSLGTSPSQFTPPYSQMPTGSPGHYGPRSPARGNVHGSPLGKGTLSSDQMNRRKGWGYSGNLPNQESTSSAHWQGQHSDVNSPNLNTGNWKQQQQRNSGNAGGHGSFGSGKPFLHPKGAFHDKAETSSSLPDHGDWDPNYRQFSDVNSPNFNAGNWKQQQQRHSGNAGGRSSFGSAKPSLHPKGAHDKAETSSSLPDPGDWDPNYSDDLLLQDDPSEVGAMTIEFSKSMHLSQNTAPTESFGGVGRFNQMSKSNMLTQRPNGPMQSFSHAEAGGSASSPDAYVHPMMNPSQYMPHFSQFSPSRLGQQPAPRYTHGRSMGGVRGGEWNHMKVQAPHSNFNSGGPRSPGSNNSAPWGRRGNHPIAANILPSSHGGNEYGRIA